MRQINLTQRSARMLSENLEGNTEGYHRIDIMKLDWIIGKLATAQGEYGEKLAEIGRTEKRLRRQFRKKEITEQELLKCLNELRLDVADLHEEAETVPVSFALEEADWKLIKDKLDSVEKWSGAAESRSIVIQMLQAIDEAPLLEIEPSKNGKAKDAKEPALSLVGEGDG